MASSQLSVPVETVPAPTYRTSIATRLPAEALDIAERPSPFPFSAIVGQEEMKLAFLISAIDPRSAACWSSATAAQANRPPFGRSRPAAEDARRPGCPYDCDPAQPTVFATLAGVAHASTRQTAQRAGSRRRSAAGRDRRPRRRRARSRARAVAGRKVFEPGLLAKGQSRLSLYRRGRICSRIISSTCCSTSRRPATT